MLTLSEHAIKSPKLWFWVNGWLSICFILLVLLPTVSPTNFSLLEPLHIDTDPENMLPHDEPVRVFHNQMKQEFELYEMIVVGVINDAHPSGVFNVKSLANIFELVRYGQQITWEEEGVQNGVIGIDVIAPSTVDNIEQGGLGSVSFEWLMPQPPATEADAVSIAHKAERIPLLKNTLVSEDSKAIALYFPIASKNDGYKVAEKLREKIHSFHSTDKYHITGLPVAQDQFGIEMFKQMAISAPIAMLLIFVLMWWFFRHVRLVSAPLIVAMISVIFTMGLLVVTGNTVHIMSSMIPIFVMPIAVLDSVHILSDFYDRYPEFKDRKKTLSAVMQELSKPMLFTSITTCAGFASLVLTPIPPVQVFGVFVAAGVFFAWLFTITLVPAYIMLMPESSLEGFGLKKKESLSSASLLSRSMFNLSVITFRHGKLILFVTVIFGFAAAYGINQIRINDNPVKWFSKDHPIRVADKALNERFAGTYMAYLALEPRLVEDNSQVIPELLEWMKSIKSSVANDVKQKINSFDAADANSLETLINFAQLQQDSTDDSERWGDWDRLLLKISELQQRTEFFKQPNALTMVEELQEYLVNTGLVGKTNGLPDIVKTVHRELFLGAQHAFTIPKTQAAVAQTLLTYQSSHRPQDLWHFVTPDYRKANLWVQLKSGDNKDMSVVVEAVSQYFDNYSGDIQLSHQWFGLTYINVVWQEQMVEGMLKAFLSSFVIVLLMMIFLFRSVWWGLLCMLPLTVTISAIYGLIGVIGKDYDMPVAVLSALSLGLAVDYAIHFLARSRYLQQREGSWSLGIGSVFGEPARAISRNVIVIGVGFLPLLAAPLIPYQTVGVFISAILLFAGVASLFILPAVLTQFETLFFKSRK